MPWRASYGPFRHTKKATTPKRRRAWAKVANKVLTNRKYGSTVKKREGAAVRIANSVVNRLAGRRPKNRIKRSTIGRLLHPVYHAFRSKNKTAVRNSRGRKAGFKHSAATKQKISASLRRHHRARRRK